MALVDAAVAVDLGLRSLGASGAGVVYVDRAVREPGDVVVGARTFALTRPALVDAQTGESVLTVSADRPPVFGRLPGTWVVAVDPHGRADLAP
jgi:hypothetical protein